jgi:hypothetical protein
MANQGFEALVLQALNSPNTSVFGNAVSVELTNQFGYPEKDKLIVVYQNDHSSTSITYSHDGEPVLNSL